uniref:F-box domain-containing protein n=1 Tax=Mola mola TaxID=94237 RepID=A0A3Q3VRY7_MOLML
IATLVNILIDVLSYLSVRELVRAGRVCKRWKRLIKDQRLWRTVDLTSQKGVRMFLARWFYPLSSHPSF